VLTMKWPMISEKGKLIKLPSSTSSIKF